MVNTETGQAIPDKLDPLHNKQNKILDPLFLIIKEKFSMCPQAKQYIVFSAIATDLCKIHKNKKISVARIWRKFAFLFVELLEEVKHDFTKIPMLNRIYTCKLLKLLSDFFNEKKSQVFFAKTCFSEVYLNMSC